MAGDLTISTINGGPIAGMRNAIINGNFGINQRVYVSGAATTAGQYTLDRWKVTGTGGITFSTVNNKTTVTIPSGQTLQQVIEGLNLQDGTYVLSWEGTAQGKIGAGSFSGSGVTATVTGGTDLTIEFGPGTVSRVQFEPGSVATAFEHRPVGTERALCMRYYRLSEIALGVAVTSTAADIVFRHPVQMRVSPTLTQLASGVNLRVAGSTSNIGITLTSLSSGVESTSVQLARTTGTWTAGNAVVVQEANVVSFAAEL